MLEDGMASHKDRNRTRVMGFTKGTGRNEQFFGSLILAKRDDDGTLKYVGQVGSGFDIPELRRLTELLKKHIALTPMIKAKDANNNLIPFTPVDLPLEITVKFFEVTKGGVFRFPSILKDKQGNNLIHYDSTTIQGTSSHQDLKHLLESLRRS